MSSSSSDSSTALPTHHQKNHSHNQPRHIAHGQPVHDHVASKTAVIAIEEDESVPGVTAWKDIVAGTAAGVAITLVGHPFDTVKVRLQTQSMVTASKHPAFTGGFDVTVKTIRNEGFRALYKGMASPLATVPLLNAVVFASYEHCKRWLGASNEQELSIGQITLSGAYAGLINSLIVGPMELVKSRLQVQYNAGSARAQYAGPVDCARQIVRANGLRGLFKGMSPTVVREIPAYAAQFYTYEMLKRALTPEGAETNELGSAALMFCGGTAGIAAWVISYPQDVVKNRIQVQSDCDARPFKIRGLDGGFRDAWARALHDSGWRGLWRGFGPCIARAFPANAAGFLAYENCAQWLDRSFPTSQQPVLA